VGVKIALLVGHSRLINGKRDGGAVAADGKTNEWTFNRAVARLVQTKLLAAGHHVSLWDHYEGNGYTASMLWVTRKVKEAGVQVAVELHFNHLDGKNDDKGHGHEWLYWHTSEKGCKLAGFLSEAEKEIIPEVVTRALLPRKSGRGAVFLELTHCPAVIGEPFFGDDDWDKVDVERVAAVYVKGLLAYAKHYKL
jgi:N-acetylmuramoyl-L-alanine amidase